MNKKITISLVILICIVMLNIALWYIQDTQKDDDIIKPQVQQNNTETLPSVDVVDIEKEQNQEIQSIDILYNADGSIDTSNWKTYRNEEYGFEVKYPEEIYKVVSDHNLSNIGTHGKYKSILYLIDKNAKEQVGRDYIAISLEILEKETDFQGMVRFMSDHDHIPEDDFYKTGKIGMRDVVYYPITMGAGWTIGFLHNSNTVVDITVAGSANANNNIMTNAVFKTVTFK